MREVHRERPNSFHCDLPCTASFKRAATLEVHKLGNLCLLKKKPCSHCGNLIRGSINTHIDRYNCPGKYPCSECNYSFATKKMLSDHKQITHTLTGLVVVVPQTNSLWTTVPTKLTLIRLLHGSPIFCIYYPCDNFNSRPILSLCSSVMNSMCFAMFYLYSLLQSIQRSW